MTRMYTTAHWKIARNRQLALDPTCVFCREVGRLSPAVVVDHITPHRGDPALFYDAGNLQSLCKTCHDAVKQAKEKSGHLRGSDVDGLPLDAKHPWFREVDE